MELILSNILVNPSTSTYYVFDKTSVFDEAFAINQQAFENCTKVKNIRFSFLRERERGRERDLFFASSTQVGA